LLKPIRMNKDKKLSKKVKHRNAHLGVPREDVQTRNQDGHEGTDNTGAPTSVEVTHNAHNDPARHHPDTVQTSDEIGRDAVEMVIEEERKPEEEAVVCQLEKSERQRIL